MYEYAQTTYAKTHCNRQEIRRCNKRSVIPTTRTGQLTRKHFNHGVGQTAIQNYTQASPSVMRYIQRTRLRNEIEGDELERLGNMIGMNGRDVQVALMDDAVWSSTLGDIASHSGRNIDVEMENLSVNELLLGPDQKLQDNDEMQPSDATTLLYGGGAYKWQNRMIVMNQTLDPRFKLHELGHWKQHIEMDMTDENTQRVLLEYHNITLHENRYNANLRVKYNGVFDEKEACDTSIIGRSIPELAQLDLGFQQLEEKKLSMSNDHKAFDEAKHEMDTYPDASQYAIKWHLLEDMGIPPRPLRKLPVNV